VNGITFNPVQSFKGVKNMNDKETKGDDQSLIQVPDDQLESILQFEKQKENMTLYKFDQRVCGQNYNLLSMAPEKFFKLLLKLFSKDQNVNNIQMDEDTYSVGFNYSGEKGKTNIVIDIFEGDGGSTVINYRKGRGCALKYQLGL